MKKIIVISVLAFLFTFCSCTAQTQTDINEFLKILGTGNVLSAESADFRITKSDNNRYRYSYAVDDNTMLCLYSGKDGVIVQCTVTSLVRNSDFQSLCTEVTRAFTGLGSSESAKLVKSAFVSPVEQDDFKLLLIDSKVGYTFLINHISDELNTNEHPTLKRHINKEDISRPTIGTEETTIKHY